MTQRQQQFLTACLAGVMRVPEEYLARLCVKNEINTICKRYKNKEVCNELSRFWQKCKNVPVKNTESSGVGSHQGA